jgi:hypothetical protein
MPWAADIFWPESPLWVWAVSLPEPLPDEPLPEASLSDIPLPEDPLPDEPLPEEALLPEEPLSCEDPEPLSEACSSAMTGLMPANPITPAHNAVVTYFALIARLQC